MKKLGKKIVSLALVLSMAMSLLSLRGRRQWNIIVASFINLLLK